MKPHSWIQLIQIAMWWVMAGLIVHFGSWASLGAVVLYSAIYQVLEAGVQSLKAGGE